MRLYGSAKLDLAWSGGTLASARITGGMGDQREVRLGERRASVRLVPDGSVTLTAADFV